MPLCPFCLKEMRELFFIFQCQSCRISRSNLNGGENWHLHSGTDWFNFESFSTKELVEKFPEKTERWMKLRSFQ